MAMCGMAPRWHTGWILMPAVTVIFLALLIAGLVLAAAVLEFIVSAGVAPTPPLDYPSAPRKC